MKKIKVTILLLITALLLSSCARLNLDPQGTIGNIAAAGAASVDTATTDLLEEAKPVYSNPNSNLADNGNGGGDTCIHEQSYHSYSGVLIDYVGEDNFYKWVEEAHKRSEEANDPNCKYSQSNIYELIKYFNIPKEDFQRLYKYSYAYSSNDYNVELLYSGDKEKVEEYYSGDGAVKLRDEMERRSLIRRIKQEFVIQTYDGTLSNDKYKQWLKELGADEVAKWMKEKTGMEIGELGEQLWSLPQFIYDHGIPIERANAIMESLRRVEGMRFDLLDYDVDKIYNDNIVIKQAIENHADADSVDFLSRK